MEQPPPFAPTWPQPGTLSLAAKMDPPDPRTAGRGFKMTAHEKGRTGWHREAASQQTPSRHRIGTMPPAQPHRLPAYGRALVDAQKQGLNVPWLCIALAWDLARILPRVVVTQDTPAHELDLRLVDGLSCMVVHRGQTHRALDIAEAALLAGATLCPVFDVALRRMTTSTDEVMAARGLRVEA